MDLDRAKSSQRCGIALIGMGIRACPFEILYVNRYMTRERRRCLFANSSGAIVASQIRLSVSGVKCRVRVGVSLINLSNQQIVLSHHNKHV